MSETRACRWCRQDFIINDGDMAMYKKFNVPYPTLCPDDRAKRRFAFRNERRLFYRKCSLTGEMMLSMYREDTSFPVYKNDKWFSDSWERPFIEYDFDKPFFEQFKTLQMQVPRMALLVITPSMVNSDYNNCAGYLKNCYLLSNSDNDEDCYYGSFFKRDKNCIDGIVLIECELCYFCVDCHNCYHLQYAQNCQNCRDSYFLENCVGCSDCLMCTNLKRKSYCILNKQYTKEEYQKKLSELSLGKWSLIQQLHKKFQELYKKSPHPSYYGAHNENSIGNYLNHCKNAYHCFEVVNAEDCRYCIRVGEVKDCMDHAAWGLQAELFYECMSCGDFSYNLKFCVHCWNNCMNLEYCDMCLFCKNCFGCVGLYKKEYCIFNKQFSQEEYEVLVSRIIQNMRTEEEYGEFFPMDLSCHPYNDAIAQDFFPLVKQEALQQGALWEDIQEKESSKIDYIIPDDIKDVGDDSIKKVLVCAQCSKPFRLIQQEYTYYKQYTIPLPHYCFDCRYKELMKKRLPRKLFKNTCPKTGKEIVTPFSPESGYIVYDKDEFDRDFA